MICILSSQGSSRGDREMTFSHSSPDHSSGIWQTNEKIQVSSKSLTIRDSLIKKVWKLKTVPLTTWFERFYWDTRAMPFSTPPMYPKPRLMYYMKLKVLGIKRYMVKRRYYVFPTFSLSVIFLKIINWLRNLLVKAFEYSNKYMAYKTKRLMQQNFDKE